MSKTDDDGLGPSLARRLRLELDRVQPHSVSPRYADSSHRPVTGWRFAPAAVVVSVAAMVALTATVATGSTNPVVWTQRVVTTIHSQPTAAPAPGQEDHHAVPTDEPSHETPTEPSERAEPSERPEPTETPEAKDSSESGRSSGQSGDH